jgi:hypothetical protein
MALDQEHLRVLLSHAQRRRHIAEVPRLARTSLVRIGEVFREALL